MAALTAMVAGAVVPAVQAVAGFSAPVRPQAPLTIPLQEGALRFQILPADYLMAASAAVAVAMVVAPAAAGVIVVGVAPMASISRLVLVVAGAPSTREQTRS
jgi:hypothetical protein